MIMSLQSNKIIDGAIGMIFGIAIGDAKGIPFENLTQDQIIELENIFDEKEQLFFHVNGHNPYIPKDWPLGRWGDTTQLSLAMMRAIIKYIFDDTNKLSLMTSTVDEHIKEWWDCTDGWNNGTKDAIERIARGTHTYLNSGIPSSGNGIMMKLTPLAFFFYVCHIDFDEHLIESICRMTHPSTVVIVTACIYFHLCIFIFKNGLPLSQLERQTFLQYLHQVSMEYELKYKLENRKDLLSIRIYGYLTQMNQINDTLLIDISHGGTFFCVDTLSMVIGLLIEKEITFETIVKASKIGGDTNRIAAMIGAILGASRGEKVMDYLYTVNVYRSDDIRQIAEEYGQALATYLKR
jgi:ADP-ribosylglycohydrolase